jgi:hypothetical protein
VGRFFHERELARHLFHGNALFAVQVALAHGELLGRVADAFALQEA